MRYYYEVLVASRYYHGQKPLTYHNVEKLLPGAIVSLQLKNQPVLGIIAAEVKQPGFTTKELKAVELPPLPGVSLELIKWFKDYYPAPFGSIVQLFLPATLNNGLDQLKAKKIAPVIKSQEL